MVSTRPGVRSRPGMLAAGVAAALTVGVLAVPAAEARKTKLDGQLIAPAISKGKRVKAAVLLSQKSARKLKLDTPLATLVVRASKTIKAPNPAGKGKVKIPADSLRPGDHVKGRGKAKGKRKLIPKVRAKRLKVKSRESRYSVDELTDALLFLFGQLYALSNRFDEFSASVQATLADLQAQIDVLKDQDLQAQIDAMLARLAALEAGLAALEADVAALSTQVGDLENAVTQLQADVATLESEVDALEADVNALCADPLLVCPSEA